MKLTVINHFLIVITFSLKLKYLINTNLIIFNSETFYLINTAFIKMQK